ncbi:CRISPR-associated endoribonuclease Cas6 [Larkinella sp.]|uniref:CRISPR-associated endoribonuclease Cas6 n=1 Tax=Larkinella sp. TaxID=2034517 RepID=UPI003BAB04E2
MPLRVVCLPIAPSGIEISCLLSVVENAEKLIAPSGIYSSFRQLLAELLFTFVTLSQYTSMRLQLQLTPNTQPVPFTYLYNLVGSFHKWLGKSNSLHDGMSMYSFGRLAGGEKIGNNLYFPQGSSWSISFQDSDQAWALVKGILKDANMAFGMRVEQALEIPTPTFGECVRLATDGEILVRTKRPDGSRQYLLWSDLEADNLMTQLMRKKLLTAGYDETHQAITIRFDREYSKARTRLMDVKGIKHRGSVCPVIVEGTPEAICFAWLVGVGELTGSGFGALV